MYKKYQIFISSTYTDLIEERKYVQDTIMKMEHFPVGMEIFSASSTKQWNIIKRTIDLSDYYVLIIGYRYGSEMEDGISYTEREFLYARNQGVPIIAFIKEDGLPATEKDIELSPKKRKKLEQFIETVKKDREVAWWTTKEDLSNKVLLALHKEFSDNERHGWTRTDDLSSEATALKKKINELMEKNDKLKSENCMLIEENNKLKNKDRKEFDPIANKSSYEKVDRMQKEVQEKKIDNRNKSDPMYNIPTMEELDRQWREAQIVNDKNRKRKWWQNFI